MLKIIKLGATLCALLSFSLASSADPIQDANKLFKQGQNAQALDKVNSFLATKPKDAQARFLKGLIINEQGNSDGAIKIFSELTDDYPELPEPYNNLAVLYAGKGQYDLARSALEMAIRTHPNYATAHENLGDIYAKMASQSYERALQLDKTNIGAQTKIALIRDLFGKGSHANKAAHDSASAVAVAAPATANNSVTAPPPASSPVAAAPGITISAPISAKPLVAALAPAPADKTESVTDTSVSAEILKVTNDWAAAWSSRESKNYFAFYAKGFKTPAGTDRAAWEAQRKKRIDDAQSIRVEVADAKVKVLNMLNVSVNFRQNLRTGNLNSTSRKTLLWVKENGQWQIAEEHTIKQ